MTRIAHALDHARAERRAALVIYLCAGDPSPEATLELLRAAERGGADVIELGMPFSDPTADGPTIQRASQRALRAGTKLRGVLDLVRRFREQSEVPVVLFGYVNPLLRYGFSELTRDAAEAGVDGLLVVDLPPEECGELRDAALAQGLDWIPLVAPTSTPQRVERAAELATSFLYCVSMTGVTGTDAPDLAAAARAAAELGARVHRPAALGFGVRTAEDVRAAAAHVDAVVVGSAVVREIEASESAEEATQRVGAKVASLRGGCAR